jgi:co-chaperonin GroES (HSP10)
MAVNYTKVINGTLRPIGNRVIVTDMYFGEQKTKSGLIIRDDDGTTRGIYPRWGRVHAKGPDNTDDYNVGDWVLVEHGRWTRSFNVDEGNGEFELRMVETESIIAWNTEAPAGVNIGAEYNDGEHATVDPSAFVSPQF